MSSVEEFAALVESFAKGKLTGTGTGTGTGTVTGAPTPTPPPKTPLTGAPTPKTPLKAFSGYQATLTSVCSIQCLRATFCGFAGDSGGVAVGVSVGRFVAVVVKYGVGVAPETVWELPCRSLNQAKTLAEDACRSFAANNAYLE